MKLEYKPKFLRTQNVSKLVRVELINVFDDMMEELFKLDFPFAAPGSPEYQKTFRQYQNYYYNKTHGGPPPWAYFPWRRVAVKLLGENDFFRLRTARNKFLITEQEQSKFYNSTVGVAGLSVGSAVVNLLVLTGGAKNLRLADFDTLSLVNLNRLLGSVCELGVSKTVNMAKRVYEINPFAQVDLFADGITERNINTFLTKGGKKLDLLIEEMDDIKLKIDLRLVARRRKIPVIMATDNGDNAIIDVERFDLEPKRPLFHGRVEEKILRSVPEKPTQAERVKLAATLVGAEITPRTQYSLMQVGTKIPTWPQLGTAATLSGVALAYVARKILTGQDMPSGRYFIDLDKTLDPMFDSPEFTAYRDQQRRDFVSGLELLYGVKL